MYEAHFGLTGRPFLAAILADRFYPARAIEFARRVLSRAIERCEGAGVVLGPAGSGKSLLCQVLLEQFRDRLACVLLCGGRLASRRALLRALLFELGVPVRGLDEDELWLALAEQFGPQMPLEAGLLLLVDDAHLLSCRLLEELRVIGSFTSGGQPRVRLVLAGCSDLEQKLAHPRLASLEQQITARCVLETLSGEEVAAYVNSQLALVGGTATELFGHAALAAVARVTEGIPRLINQVCDHAMILAYADGASSVSEAHVERAWADLQQIPLLSLHGGEANAREHACVIEFGGLEEDSSSAQTLEFPAQPDQPTVPLPASQEALSRYLEEAHAAPGIAPASEDQSEHQSEHQCEYQGEHPSEHPSEHQSEDQYEYKGEYNGEHQSNRGSGHRSEHWSPESEEKLDPFGGPYAEEEVVLDRFANYDDSLFRTLPHVASLEGTLLSSLLQPHMAVTPAPRLVLAGTEPDECDALPQIVVEEDPSDQHASPFRCAPQGVCRLEYTQLFSRLRG